MAGIVQGELLDTGMAPEIYVDDVGAVDNLGPNCRVIYFTYARPPGSALFERVVVLKVIRPISSVRSGAITAMLREQPIESGVRRMLHA